MCNHQLCVNPRYSLQDLPRAMDTRDGDEKEIDGEGERERQKDRVKKTLQVLKTTFENPLAQLTPLSDNLFER